MSGEVASSFVRTFEGYVDGGGWAKFTTGHDFVYGSIETDQWDANVLALGSPNSAVQAIQWSSAETRKGVVDDGASH